MTTNASPNVFTVNNSKSDWSVTLGMNGTDVNFKIDTGAQCNVIPKRLLSNLSQTTIPLREMLKKDVHFN